MDNPVEQFTDFKTYYAHILTCQSICNSLRKLSKGLGKNYPGLVKVREGMVELLRELEKNIYLE